MWKSTRRKMSWRFCACSLPIGQAARGMLPLPPLVDATQLIPCTGAAMHVAGGVKGPVSHGRRNCNTQAVSCSSPSTTDRGRLPPPRQHRTSLLRTPKGGAPDRCRGCWTFCCEGISGTVLTSVIGRLGRSRYRGSIAARGLGWFVPGWTSEGQRGARCPTKQAVSKFSSARLDHAVDMLCTSGPSARLSLQKFRSGTHLQQLHTPCRCSLRHE